MAKADVTVTNKTTGDKQYVKAVTLADDKKSATVDFYDPLTSKTTYTVAVKSGESTVSKDYDFVAGEPAKIEVQNLVVAHNTATALKYKVLDENGLDITADVKNKTVFKTTAGSVSTDGKITLASTASPAFVVVEVTKADGTVLKSDRFTVEAQQLEATTLATFTVDKGAPGTSTYPAWDSKDFKANNLISKDGTSYSLYISVKDQFGEVLASPGAIEFESLSKDILLVDRATGALTPLKAGIADVRIKVGKVNTIVSVNVGEEAKVGQLSFDKTELNVSEKVTAAQTVKVTLKDQFDREFKASASYQVKATVKSGADFIELVGATNGSVTNTITTGNSETSFSVKAKKAGTAVIEISSVADETVKGTVTVNVTAAGAVSDFAVEGFKAELDQNADTSNKNKTMNLQVYPVDSKGVKTGDELTSAKLTVKDKNNKYVIGYAPTDSKTTGNAVDIDSANFAAGETYTAIVSVGDLDIFTKTFTVKDTTAAPSVELMKNSLNVGADILADINSQKTFAVSFKGTDQTSAIAMGLKFNSDSTGVVSSSASSIATTITGKKAGDASLVISEVKVDLDGNLSTTTDQYVVKYSTVLNVKVLGADTAQLSAKVTPEASVAAEGKTKLAVGSGLTSGNKLYASAAGSTAVAAPVKGSARNSTNFATEITSGTVEVSAIAGQHITIIEVDAQDNVVAYKDIVVTADQLGVLADEDGLTATIENVEGTTGKTKFTVADLATGHKLYASAPGSSAVAAPVKGSVRSSSDFATEITAGNVEIAVTADKHISVVEVDANGKVVGYKDFTIAAEDIGA